MRLRNWFLFSIVVLIWGSSWPGMRIALAYVDPLNLVLHRFFLAVLVFVPFTVILRNKIPKDRKNLLGLVLLGSLTALFELSVNIGMVYERSGIGATLTYTQPFFVFGLAVVFLKERPRVSRFLGIVIGFSGAALLSINEMAFSNSLFPILLLIASAIFWGASSVFCKKFLGHVDPIMLSILQIDVATVVVALADVTLNKFYFPLSIEYISALLYLGVGAYCVATTLWYVLLREEEVTVLSSSSLIVPMVAFFFGWLLLGESIEIRTLVGVLLTLTGIYLVNRVPTS